MRPFTEHTRGRRGRRWLPDQKSHSSRGRAISTDFDLLTPDARGALAQHGTFSFRATVCKTHLPSPTICSKLCLAPTWTWWLRSPGGRSLVRQAYSIDLRQTLDLIIETQCTSVLSFSSTHQEMHLSTLKGHIVSLLFAQSKPPLSAVLSLCRKPAANEVARQAVPTNHRGVTWCWGLWHRSSPAEIKNIQKLNSLSFIAFWFSNHVSAQFSRP